jgi:chromosome segregation ATPase
MRRYALGGWNMSLVLKATLLAMIFVGANAHAGKEWKSSTESDAQGKICVASASVSEGKSGYTMQVRVRDGLSTQTEILLARNGPPLAVKGFQGRIGTNGPQIQFSSLAVNGTVEYYYGLPHNTLAVIQAMAANKEIDLAPVGGQHEELDFTLKGFATAVKELEKCSKNQPLANNEFEQILTGTSALSVDLARLTQAVTQDLRKIAGEAYPLFIQRKANQKALADLRAKYAAEIAEYERLNARISKIQGTELPDLASRRARLVTQLSQAEQELRDTQANLPKIEARVATAQTAYDRAYAILAPHIPKHDQLVNYVNSAESNLAASQARLRQVESDIVQTNNRLRDLHNKLTDLRYEIDRLRRELDNARYELRIAEQNLNAFNYQAEYDRYLQQHNHSGLKSQESSLQSQLYTAQNQTAQARSEFQSAQSALQSCQATPGSDCSSQQMNYNSAQSALSQAQSQENSISSQLRSVQNQVADVERRARKQADDRLDDLQDKKRDAQQRVINIENRINTAQSEIYDIQNYQIPRNENILRTLESERSQLIRTIDQEEAALARAERELAEYERQVDWQTKKRNVDTTKAELNAATKALSHARLRLQQLPGEISSYKTQINDIDATVAQLNAELVQLKKASADLQPTIDRYNAEKAPLDAIEKRLAAQLAEMNRRYLAALNI